MSIPYVYSVYIKPIIESDHPNKHDIDEYYVFETGLTSVKIVFDSEYIRKYIIERYGRGAFVHRMKNCFDEVISLAENQKDF